MVRIAGVNLPDKRVMFSLPRIYGVGQPLAKEVCLELKIDPMKKIGELSSDDISKIEKYINSRVKVEGELRREVQSNIKRLVEISSYRGSRHHHKLPARGQRTKTNARTKKGKVKTVGSGKRKLTKK
ncbi:MAG: 30S ribosomal protein S13 [Patescibacteria group bacterium]|nr:30S ribosomal protein S13 [Patescibacteria group bacterium]MCL5257960.1 30S ribosomal protein S13 [Patescibacteria group bacterium]